ncbi:hypothetical protein PAHAL_9G043000 [Panicum hallii]|uniref:Uncharacterized protein n=1 Tax=Panicum hallii TaxID=206008 RepID=A0A2T8I037_9POAL|nr:hypothetical protein PAHAL_9G043000 [Panicum hallii]
MAAGPRMQPSDKAMNQPRTARGKRPTNKKFTAAAANPSKPGGEIHAAARQAGGGAPARLLAVRASPSLPRSPRTPRPRIGGSGSVSIHDGAAGVGGVGGAGVGGGVAAGGVQPGDAPARPRPRADLLRAAPPPRAPRRLPLHPLPPRASPRPPPAPPRPPRLPRPPASGACAAPLHLLVQLLLVLVFGG